MLSEMLGKIKPSIREKAFSAPRVAHARIKERCKADILYYLDTFAWTFNPRATDAVNRVVPFIAYPFQRKGIERTVRAVERQRDLAIEKSRDVGVTWWCLYVLEWLWHFHDYTQSVALSRNWELVDGKTPDSLFWKIDFIHRKLPEWLMPKGWEARKHRLKGYFENPENGSTITGQATTEKSTVGGRATVALLDEFGMMSNAEEIRDRTADVTDCRIFASAHYTGAGTCFHKLCTNGVTEKLQIHWSEHPVKGRGLYKFSEELGRAILLDEVHPPKPDYNFNTTGRPAGGARPGVRSPWYDGECKRRGSDRAIATQLDIDVEGSTSLLVDPLHLANLRRKWAIPPVWRGDIEVDEKGRCKRLIKADEGPLSLWVQPDHDGRMGKLRTVIGGDLSWGTGATPSCLEGFRQGTGEQVVEYVHAHLDPKRIAGVLTALGWLFVDEYGQEARLIWEMQGPGMMSAGRIIDTGYSNFYYHASERPERLSYSVSDRPGWCASASGRTQIIKEFWDAVSHEKCVVRSDDVLAELLRFSYDANGYAVHALVKHPSDPSGAREGHGDRVIGAALAWKEIQSKGGTKTETKKADDLPDPGSLAWRMRFHETMKRKYSNGW